MNATITNLIKEKNGFRIFVSFSDGTESNYSFPIESTEEEIENKIKEVLEEKITADKKVSSMNFLIGKTFNL
jgi:hypothetical protein